MQLCKIKGKMMKWSLKYRYVFITLLMHFFWVQSVYSLQKLSKPRSITTSIIIPCHWKHAPLLKEALQAYAQQTVLPQEVVISLSEVSKVSPQLLAEIEQYPWPFQLVLLKHSVPVSEGSNRNFAASVAKGNVLICSDADDLPHWQRVEIIKWFFENYNLDFLIHLFVFDPSQFIWLKPENIAFSVPVHVNEGGPHANGAVAVSKNLWHKKKWNPRFEKALDAEFNGAVYAAFPNRILLHVPIYHYRNYLTSYDPD
jgi:hypothetical protein